MTLSTTRSDTNDRILGREEDVDTTTSESTTIAPESIPERPTKAEVLDAIIRETGCTRSAAGNGLAWLKRVVKTVRTAHYKPYTPSLREMKGQPYAVIDSVIPHGVASTPGSAHSLLEEHLLDRTQNETGIFHDNPSYCRFSIDVGSLG